MERKGTKIKLTASWLICIIYLAIVICPTTAVSDIHFQVLEEQPEGFMVGNISTVWGVSPDHGDNLQFLVDSAITDEIAKDLFSIDSTTGVLSTAQVLDRDEICKYLDTCTLSLGIGVISSTRYESISVSVEVIDINDNSPKFPLSTESIGIPENTDVNTLFPLSEAYDVDSGVNGLQSYDLRPQSNQFDIVIEDDLDGTMDVQLIVLSPLDREIQDSYTLYLVASDAGSPVLSSSMTLNITIVDINDNVATFTQVLYEFDVMEDIGVTEVVASVRANDPDMGAAGKIIYEFSAKTQALYGDTFTLNQNGDIILAKPLDYETKMSYELTVSARDSAPNARNSFTKVMINVMDVNDFSPQISVTTLPNSGHAEILENADVDTFVAHVSVIDRDSGPSGEVNCSLDNSGFRLQAEGGGTQFKLVTAVSFDREISSSDQVTITCRDQGTPPLISEKLIDVSVKDINDNKPIFDKSMYSIVLQENNAAGVYVTTVTARDSDYGVNSRLSYSIVEQVARDSFEINDNGMITATKPLDHEAQQVILFHVRAQDGAAAPMSATTAVQIQLVDVNDSPPTFSQNTFEFVAVENQPAGVDIGHLVATDADSAPYNNIRYAFKSDAFALRALFDLDRESGLLKTKAPYDRETKDSYVFQVIAYNPDLPILNSTATVSISVEDLNDIAPRFIFPSPENHSIQITGDLEAGQFVVQARAIDTDIGNNAWLKYSIDTGNDDGFFAIGEHSGAITVAKDLSKSSQKKFNLTIVVQDHGTPPLFSGETLEILATGARPRRPEDDRYPANMIILICLVSVTGILMILLLVAILWLVYKSRYRRSKKKYSDRSASEENLGPKVEIIDRLDTLTTGDLNTSFRDQHLYDQQKKPGMRREGPINSHNSADSGFDEHPEATISQYGRHVSFNIRDQSQASNNKRISEDVQDHEISSTSSEEGSNTDSGCVLSEGVPDGHESHPQVPQRTYPTAPKSPRPSKSQRVSQGASSALFKPSQSSGLHVQRPQSKVQNPSRNSSQSAQAKSKPSAVKLRYVDQEWPDICKSVDIDDCALAMKHGILRNFSDSNSVMRYKVKHPSAQKCTSEYTDNTSSTSGSYILTADEQGATAC